MCMMSREGRVLVFFQGDCGICGRVYVFVFEMEKY